MPLAEQLQQSIQNVILLVTAKTFEDTESEITRYKGLVADAEARVKAAEYEVALLVQK